MIANLSSKREKRPKGMVGQKSEGGREGEREGGREGGCGEQ